MQNMNDELPQEETFEQSTEAAQTSEASGTQDESGDAEGDAGVLAGGEASAERAVGRSPAGPAYEIDGRAFNSEKEAIDWLLTQKNDLERERLIADAYRSGIQDAAGRLSPDIPQVPQQEDEDPDWETRYYQDPKAALAERERKAEERILRKIQQQQSAAQAEREVWDKFCASHPDLADFRSDVETVANSPENIQIVQALARTKGEQAAIDYVAQKTRAKFQAYMRASQQRTVLPRSTVGASPTGAADRNVTLQQKSEKPLSFAEELRQFKKKFV